MTAATVAGRRAARAAAASVARLEQRRQLLRAEHAHAVAGAAHVAVHERATRSGDRVCVTLTLHVERVEDVEDMYARLYTLPDLLLIL